ncbi:hypothetical protein FN846DRAFT_931357 [Sphaerosporella brunnea]|uniref:Uncharacterized protein n=1 Tax=Sphaerosporella brunnea TaxID=1250544 RepID=A0A5J5F7Q6_9PEZI|nr:hypothetical protein FN846DRAFT_931357 [Sphaerosporella brunnea]
MNFRPQVLRNYLRAVQRFVKYLGLDWDESQSRVQIRWPGIYTVGDKNPPWYANCRWTVPEPHVDHTRIARALISLGELGQHHIAKELYDQVAMVWSQAPEGKGLQTYSEPLELWKKALESHIEPTPHQFTAAKRRKRQLPPILVGGNDMKKRKLMLMPSTTEYPVPSGEKMGAELRVFGAVSSNRKSIDIEVGTDSTVDQPHESNTEDTAYNPVSEKDKIGLESPNGPLKLRMADLPDGQSMLNDICLRDDRKSSPSPFHALEVSFSEYSIGVPPKGATEGAEAAKAKDTMGKAASSENVAEDAETENLASEYVGSEMNIGTIPLVADGAVKEEEAIVSKDTNGEESVLKDVEMSDQPARASADVDHPVSGVGNYVDGVVGNVKLTGM